MISLMEAQARLQEAGITIPRVRICIDAVDAIRKIGECYTMYEERSESTYIPAPGMINAPEGLVWLRRIEGEPLGGSIAMVEKYDKGLDLAVPPHSCITAMPKNKYDLRDGKLILAPELWDKKITLVWQSMPIGDDGWPMVHETLIDVVVYKIQLAVVGGVLFKAALKSRPTNNMIIATRSSLNKDYNKAMSYARSVISAGNTSKK